MGDSTKPTSASGDGAAGVPASAQESAKETSTVPRTGRDGQTQLPPEAAEPDARESSTAFPVVGVGASAGGLEALETFLSRMPRTGMAFVVIQHLAPAKESHLSGILSRSTRLPVSQATDGVTV